MVRVNAYLTALLVVFATANENAPLLLVVVLVVPEGRVRATSRPPRAEVSRRMVPFKVEVVLAGTVTDPTIFTVNGFPSTTL
jgi:hypothetical protein